MAILMFVPTLDRVTSLLEDPFGISLAKQVKRRPK